MRIKHKIRVHIADDTDMKNLRFAPDDSLSEVQIDTYTKQTNGDFTVSAATKEELALGDITAAKGLYLEVNKDAKVYLNGDATPIQLRRGNSTTTSKAKLFVEADISKVEVEAGTDEVTGLYAVWGDASA